MNLMDEKKVTRSIQLKKKQRNVYHKAATQKKHEQHEQTKRKEVQFNGEQDTP